MPSLYGTTYI
ncbi:Protein of unknown function [Bacillus mycoides]|uniref:Uncharacterized protein n=1 Tax=Bacillus mycoides TaxID=1405 RepID=A0A1G4EBE1_BACMY|nr:Protein of unknown function [Bacillus mycoides]